MIAIIAGLLVLAHLFQNEVLGYIVLVPIAVWGLWAMANRIADEAEARKSGCEW